MRGDDGDDTGMWSYVSQEQRIPAAHPLRPTRKMVDEALARLAPRFDKLYSRVGRPSIPPERLLRALLIQVLYTIRSERLLMEQLDYNMLFRRFGGLRMDDPIRDPPVFTKNRPRRSGKGPDDPGAAPGEDFHGEARTNAPHQSTTDPQAKLYRKGPGKEAKLCYLGHVLMENRNGLVVDGRLTQATGTAERDAAEEMVRAAKRRHRGRVA